VLWIFNLSTEYYFCLFIVFHLAILFPSLSLRTSIFHFHISNFSCHSVNTLSRNIPKVFYSWFFCRPVNSIWTAESGLWVALCLFLLSDINVRKSRSKGTSSLPQKLC
jgi:hypothetical protein